MPDIPPYRTNPSASASAWVLESGLAWALASGLASGLVWESVSWAPAESAPDASTNPHHRRKPTD
jgi:hypothetical protein